MQKTAYALRISDWSSDVCSSDLLLAVFAEIAAHFADECARRIGLGLERVGDRADRAVAILKLLFVDIGIVDAVDIERTQNIIVRNFKRLIVFVSKAFEEIHEIGRAHV